MDGIAVLKSQLQVVSAMYHDLLNRVTPEQWKMRVFSGQNLIGFTAWHMATVQDWTVHVAIRGRPELRMQAPWAADPAINAPVPPFGMTLAQADAIARTLTPESILAYHDAVNAEIHKWLDGMAASELDDVPDIAANSRNYPGERITAEYLAEVDDMVGRTVARHLASPCIGHIRGHFGEIDSLLDLMKSRQI